ncbi:DUF4197 domain-containing protein [Methylophaga thiooxydans]|uniref:DUF4197 domain-containing protein n=1 Tax=Methylophaga thiooxydans TaxID=392484 RepID=UPI002355D60E|nr:DUF4197 domain-containing protein [Methylophaga thiooxydans]
MNLKLVSLTLIISISLLSGHARADWGAMLDDLKEAGKTFMPGAETADSTLDTGTIISGLKEALSVGSKRAIDTIGQTDGFLANPKIRIPLPPQVEQVGGLMRQFGMSGLADEFETSMNRAAEDAAPEATNIVINAIKNMSIEDAKQILNGPDNAATEYFKTKTSDQLSTLFRPTIENSLDQVGSTRYYNQLSDQVSDVPVVGQNLNVDLPDYVTEQALNGLFTMLAIEEKKIRENPAARSTELLKKVFSQ